MSKIIVCFKWVKAEDDLRIDPATLNVDLSKAKGKISEYDRNAIETAKLAADASGGEAVALTYGAADAKASLKDAMSRGPKQAFWVNDQSAESADGFVTANVLASAIRKIGDYSLIICAEGAADTYAHQVGPRIGAIMDIPVISFVKEMKIEGNKLTAVRKLENSFEQVEVELPAVVTVLPEINPAPIPGLKAVLDAGKKPVTEFKIQDLELDQDDITRKTEVASFKGCSTSRKKIMFTEGDTKERVNALVAALKKEGVL
ncbi:MAG TPA: electron transfer flavoprotein beta subunit/FixA family protein [Spirochaetota bacterium]|nr:electron transfer flavoprotein beta subunit/FixA family protein [Spirochaetota bacterium]HPS86928.1 electron transfer flavoprotein beta subunit/FixA family protein [Spirochaetota bacterium]